MAAVASGSCEPAPSPPAATRPGANASAAASFRIEGWRFAFRSPEGEVIHVFDPSLPLTARGDLCSNGCTVQVPGMEDPAANGPRVGLTAQPDVPGPWRLKATVTATVGSEPKRFEQTVLVTTPPETLDEIRRVRELVDSGRHREAQHLASEFLSSADPWIALWLRREQARSLWIQGNAKAGPAYVEGGHWAEGYGAIAEATRRFAAAAFQFMAVGYFGQASMGIAEMSRLCSLPSMAAHQPHCQYYEGLLAQRTGDLLGASRLYEGSLAADWSGRVIAAMTLAEVYTTLGQHDRALDVLASIPIGERDLLDDYTLGSLEAYTVHVKLTARGGSQVSFSDAEIIGAMSARVEDWLRLGRPVQVGTALIDLAWAYYELGLFDEAQRTLDRIDAETIEMASFETAKLRQLRGDVALAQGKLLKAEAAYKVALDAASTFSSDEPSEWVWRAQHGLARVHAASGRASKAERTFEIALRERSAAAQRASLQESRATFLADRTGVVRDASAFYLTRDRPADAFRVWDAELAAILRGLDTQARRSRLDAEQSMELATKTGVYAQARRAYEAQSKKIAQLRGKARQAAIKELRPLGRARSEAFAAIYAYLDEVAPSSEVRATDAEAIQKSLAPDEMLLTAVPHDDDRFQPLWITADQVETSTQTVDAFLREDLAPRLGSVRHLYVVPGTVPELRAVHTAPTRDGRLVLESATVSYLPHAGFLVRGDPMPGRRVVVVGDPEGDLPQARREADLVAKKLGPGGTVLKGDAAARAPLVAALDGASVFHFSGHGVLAPSSPWDAHLRLASGDRLRLEDVLVTRPKAELVFLNGCETGAREELSRTHSLGLADGFLVVGSRTVVATDRRVLDQEALAMAQAFYEHGGSATPAEAFRRTVLEARKQGLMAWKDYRLFGLR